MHDWDLTLRATDGAALLLVTSEAGDLLKARLPLSPGHPRALLTLLEGLALWRGQALRVAVSAGACSVAWAGSGLFGDELYPAEMRVTRHRDREDRRIVITRIGAS
jgi:hypothetical protein